MPKAFGQKFHYDDHDADVVVLLPPVLNQWYEIFHAYDVRLLWNIIQQANDEVAIKNIEIRWTIDGNVYLVSTAAASGQIYWIFRNYAASAGGASGLQSTVGAVNAGYGVDKRGKDFRVEIRITSALGTNQLLLGTCVRETLDLT